MKTFLYETKWQKKNQLFYRKECEELVKKFLPNFLSTK